MNIQCIALDLDRTTLDSAGRLSAGNRQALEEVLAQGVHVVIASGRAFATLPEDILSVPGIEYAITSNGAAIYHVPSGRCLHRYLLTPQSVERILELTRDESISYEGFVEGCAYAAADYVRDPVRFGATPAAVSYVQRTRHLEEDIVGFLRAHIGELDSVDLVVRTEADKLRLWQLLKREVADIYLTSSVQQLLEISHRDAGKHTGFRFVLDRLGLPREAAAAFGDADNDADLLAYAGCGIAMANATPACLSAADFVTCSNDEDGVAWGIREILHL